MNDVEASSLMPGDLVRIRTWDDMASEYESDDDGIYVPGYFSDTMGILCGREFKIFNILKWGSTGFTLKDGTNDYKDCIRVILDGDASGWIITAEMLQSKESPFDEDEINEDEIQIAFQSLI